MTGKLQRVHVRVNDTVTGKPTPCRVRFTDADGTYYAPYGRLTRFAAGPNQDVGGNVYLGLMPHAYLDGAGEIDLPAGELHLEIAKGLEYKPLRTQVHLAPGKLSLRFSVERWTDLRQQGWYSGDTRVLFLPPHAALLEAQAEDVAVVNLLAVESTQEDAFGEVVKAIANLPAFSGQQFALSVPGHGVAVNTLNRHPVMGSLSLLDCHRVVYPLTFGGPEGYDDWTLADWCDQCHRKAGLVVWADGHPPAPDVGQGEALADLVLGKVDAFEMDHFDGSSFDRFGDWTRLLDAGLIATLVGASGKDSNGRALGVLRTYAHLASEFSYEHWIGAVRDGKTFITNGPLLSFQVNGAEPSREELTVKSGSSLAIHAEARSWLPFDRLAVIYGGEVIGTAKSEAGSPYRAVLDIAHPAGSTGWLIAGCFGETQIPDRPAYQRIFAATSPVYVRTGEKTGSRHSAAVRRLVDDLDARMTWVAEKANCPTPKDRERLADVFRQAKQELLAKL
jgi:hypothetical protein